MKPNQNYPWYLQASQTFTTLYDGIFNVAKGISPIDMGSFYDINSLNDTALFYLAQVWNLSNVWSGSTNALIYNQRPWSTSYEWNGSTIDYQIDLFKNYIKAKIWVQAQPMSLITIKEFFKMLLDGKDYTISCVESSMHFDVTVVSDETTVNALTNISSVDSALMGKPVGISYTVTYTTEQGD